MKKSQVTFFIVLGIVITLSAILLVFLRSANDKGTTKVVELSDFASERKAIQTYVDNCVRKQSISAISQVVEQAGYVHPTSDGIPSSTKVKNIGSFSYSPDFYYLSWLSTPNTDVIQSNIDEILMGSGPGSIHECIQNFNYFRDMNWNVTTIMPNDIITKTTIAENSVSVKLEFTKPIIFEKMGTSFELDDSISSIPLNLAAILKVRDAIINELHSMESLRSNPLEAFNFFVNNVGIDPNDLSLPLPDGASYRILDKTAQYVRLQAESTLTDPSITIISGYNTDLLPPNLYWRIQQTVDGIRFTYDFATQTSML